MSFKSRDHNVGWADRGDVASGWSWGVGRAGRIVNHHNGAVGTRNTKRSRVGHGGEIIFVLEEKRVAIIATARTTAPIKLINK